MHSFGVWAPKASRVDLEVRLDDGWQTLQMHGADDGCWGVEVALAGPGADYAFRVDGGDPTPDPRSPWQPDGVHGPSRLFDAAAHAPPAWPGMDARGAVLYELHVGTFTPDGTLDAAAGHLDQLVELGVQMVSLMPVAAFPGRHGWGYDGVHLYAVHEPYGGPAALQRFVAACHRRGLGVCLDVVYNHLGPSGNYLSRFGPYFTDRHHTPWGEAVNLDDEGSVQVRRWVVDNALRWFTDFGIDALRLDAVHELKDDSPTHVLAQLSTATAVLAAELGRPLSLVAESDLNQPRMVEPVADGGLGMTAQWSDDVHHALHALLTGERGGYYADFGTPEVLAQTLTRVFRHDGCWSTFREEAWGAPVDPHRHRGHAFLAYSANHDQVGNRALGDRPGASLTDGQLAIAATLVLTSPYTPMLFMGSEWGATTPWQFFTDHAEPELAAAVREGRRREFAAHGWDAGQVPDPQDPATRDASVLDRSEPARERHARLLAWHRELIALRSAHADLRDDDLSRVAVRHADDGSWFVVDRGDLR
ncbi:MAG TPA: malto-oligosyltrehalose trehalohydrolase, partial [Actinomycetales bacterium]|nr:malto-oligosyltrehalose trehalohydrolase [Actinomycetales bacterium]